MSDSVPVGFTTIPEALEQLESRIAGHEKFSEWTLDWINGPEEETSRSSRLRLARQGLVTGILWAAFRRGDMSAFVRDPKTSEPLRIPKEDWLSDTSWDQWLRSGVVRVAETQSLSEHNRQRLFVQADELQKFLEKQRDDSVTARRGGRPAKVDWQEIQKMFIEKCDVDGTPDATNIDGWQTKTDVVRWIATIVEIEGEGLSYSTYKKHARRFITEAQRLAREQKPKK